MVEEMNCKANIFPEMENPNSTLYTTRVDISCSIAHRQSKYLPLPSHPPATKAVFIKSLSVGEYNYIRKGDERLRSPSHQEEGGASPAEQGTSLTYFEQNNSDQISCQGEEKNPGVVDPMRSNSVVRNKGNDNNEASLLIMDENVGPSVHTRSLNECESKSGGDLSSPLCLLYTENLSPSTRSKDQPLENRNTQVCLKPSSHSCKGLAAKRFKVLSGHLRQSSETTSTFTKSLKPCTYSHFLFLSLALMCIAPVSGGYDRGGFQHQITWGRNSPPGSAVFGNSPTNVTAVVGHKARLPCQVKNLGAKDVSWIRQRDLHILTVGIFTYTSDDRFKVFHPPETEDWFLDISSVTFRDSGIYECQVSTSPKVSLPIYLTVLGMQEADIPGPDEVFIQHGSTISLQCEVQAGVEAVGPVHWLRGADTLNYSSPRGGISMEVEKTPTKTMSKLYITRATRADSGNYTCAPLYARPDSVLVHVVNAGEESAAAVHSGCMSYRHNEKSILIWVTAAMLPVTWLFLNFSSSRP